MTLVAELVYLVVWGMYLFPGGSLLGKMTWTATCGIAMGAVVGSVILLFVETRASGRRAVIFAALSMTAVGGFCAWLCSRIDIRFDYFGGPENAILFIASGVLPAVAGGLLLGWLLYVRFPGTAASA